MVGGRTDSDALIIPLHGEHTSTLGVEDRAVGRATPFGNTAASVVVERPVAQRVWLSVCRLQECYQHQSTVCTHKNIQRQCQ